MYFVCSVNNWNRILRFRNIKENYEYIDRNYLKTEFNKNIFFILYTLELQYLSKRGFQDSRFHKEK